jgi:hypothetical protein
MQSRITWRGGAATKPELILQEAAEGTEELICPLITRISADGQPHDPRPSAPSAEIPAEIWPIQKLAPISVH